MLNTTTVRGASSDASSNNEAVLYRRIAWRILPIMMVCYLFSYFDRINISFAKIQMQAELGLSDAEYGLAASLFFVGYVLFLVPANIGLQRYGAPGWICRIMIGWGLATAALVFAYSNYTLYFLRFLIGVMEAGFGAAIMFYLVCWFPRKYLARINGLWFLAIPLAGGIGGPIAGIILEELDGVLGLAGWHWLFLLSGLPCVFLGIFTVIKLDRDIKSAKWLSADEKELLLDNLERDKSDSQKKYSGMWSVLLTKEVALLTAIYVGIKLAAYGLNFWMPHLITNSGVKSVVSVGFLTSLPYFVAAGGMFIVTKQSDESGRRKIYLLGCLIVSTIGYVLASAYSDDSVMLMFALTVATTGTFIAIPLFWTIPQSYFSGVAVASGCAAINAVGQLSGIVAPTLIGYINKVTELSWAGISSIIPFLILSCWLVVKFLKDPKDLK